MTNKKPLASAHGRDFLRIKDFSPSEVRSLLDLARKLKSEQKSATPHPILQGKSLAMVLEKPSSRTRISFEVGMFQLGGNALIVNPSEIKMGERETIADVARTLSRYVDGVMIRANHHWTIEEFAEAATVPVINGLSDHHHPCQALADLLTVEEHKGDLAKATICYVGDGNNVCNSLIEICSVLGVKIVVSCPDGYDPLLRESSPFVEFIRDPFEAVKQADVVYTDVWISMGQESFSARKLDQFLNYSVTENLMSRARPRAIFMHCLPAHRGLEVSGEVIDGPNSVVFDQAENRLHTQKAVLATLL